MSAPSAAPSSSSSSSSSSPPSVGKEPILLLSDLDVSWDEKAITSLFQPFQLERAIQSVRAA